jgi:penicillin-binding protein 1A
VILGLLGTASFAYGLVMSVTRELPQLDPARYHKEQNGYIYAGNGHTILAVLRGSESRVSVRSEQIAPVMKHAIVDVEDKRFFEHHGLDLHGIARAIWADVRNEKVVEGGSTITQQFVKNAYVKNERSIGRKLKEAALSWQLEQRWSKDRILTAYLNTIYFGNGAYGVEQAARVYFGHDALKLTLPEAALLAGIPSDPSRYDPVTNRQAARARRRTVLQAMLDQHDITYNEYRAANRTPLPRPEDIRLPGTEGPAQYFANYVKQLLVDRYGTARVFGGGLRVTTSIDLDLQKLAREAIAKWLTGVGPSAALVAIDPRDGRVLAMVGGNNYLESQFNLAVQGERQPGSSFKPFVLATALAQGISPSTTLVSKPVTISLGDRDWYVRNYEGSNLGDIDLQTATTYSDNTVYAQLTELVGPAQVAATAHRLGITRHLNPYFAIGLGADPVSPLEMARAYAAFANGGFRIDGSIFHNHPRAIVSVNGTANRPVGVPALRSNNAAIVNSLLERVISEGTGRRAALADGRPEAGKTGTTENYGDAWFVGYTPQLVVAGWVGYPEGLKPMLTEFHGKAVAGGTYPSLIWKSFMEQALPMLNDDPRNFASPELPATAPRSVVLRDGRWQQSNGYCRNTVSIVYFESSPAPPTANCKPNEVEVPSVVGSTFAEAQARLALQPLTPVVVYKPASPGQRIGVVVGQIPARGRLSSYDKVTLVFAKPVHGLVPKVTGLTLEQARAKLLRMKLVPRLRGTGTRVVKQQPGSDAAAGRGLPVTLFLQPG